MVVSGHVLGSRATRSWPVGESKSEGLVSGGDCALCNVYAIRDLPYGLSIGST